MRLPTSLLESQFFVVRDLPTFLLGMGYPVDSAEAEIATALANSGLPPIISADSLAFMLGLNKGLVWSLEHRTRRYYRTFQIPKGTEFREITAPRIALKIPQKWIGYHLARRYQPPGHVFGFVPGRSYVDAAQRHVGAEWAWSFDIQSFFPTTPAALVRMAFIELGYPEPAAEFLTALCTLDGFLPQGAPTSPIISNMVFSEVDATLSEYAIQNNCRLSRYADDITLSGVGEPPPNLREDVYAIFNNTPWNLEPQKDLRQPLKGRIKVHGLLIKEDGVRLTKGYRNRLRAYKHIIETRSDVTDRAKLLGHLANAARISPDFQPNIDQDRAAQSLFERLKHLLKI